MNNRKRIGIVLVAIPSILGIYFTFWIMGYWGGHKPLFSWPEAIITFFFVMLMTGLYFLMVENS